MSRSVRPPRPPQSPPIAPPLLPGSRRRSAIDLYLDACVYACLSIASPQYVPSRPPAKARQSRVGRSRRHRRLLACVSKRQDPEEPSARNTGAAVGHLLARFRQGVLREGEKKNDKTQMFGMGPTVRAGNQSCLLVSGPCLPVSFSRRRREEMLRLHTFPQRGRFSRRRRRTQLWW